MKARTKVLCATAVFVVGLVIGGNIIAAAAQNEPNASVVDRTLDITVTGEASIKIRPDQAIIKIGTVTEDETATGAWQKNAEIADEVVRALERIGIAEDQIETTKYILETRKENIVRDKWGNIISYVTIYVCTHDLQVTVKDLDKAGGVIDAAVGAGANHVYSIEFTRSPDEIKELKRDAFRAAVKDAREQAEMVADAFGAVVIEVVSIPSLQKVNYYRPMYDLAWSAELGGSPPPTPIQPGSVEIEGKVTVTYKIGWLKPIY